MESTETATSALLFANDSENITFISPQTDAPIPKDRADHHIAVSNDVGFELKPTQIEVTAIANAANLTNQIRLLILSEMNPNGSLIKIEIKP